MKDLNKKAAGGLAQFLIGLALLLLLPAGTVDYWQAWIFLAVFSSSVLAITVYLMKNDPELLERRLRAGPAAEKEKIQRIIQSAAGLAFLTAMVCPAIDHRFAWSMVPWYVTAVGDALVALGLLIIFFVFKENTYTSATIEIHPEQTVVSTGPYAIVRHPMYAGAIVMLLGVPLALGSWWGLLTIIPISLMIAWRLLEEEKLLAANLPRYSEYRNRVRYRLVPLIW